jgi:hypothetical protein
LHGTLHQVMARSFVGFFVLVPLGGACASPPPPSVEPPPSAEPPPPPAASAPPPAPSAPPADDGPARSQEPLDILTARDAAFQIDYGNSEAKTKAAERCEKESKGDAEKQSACIAKARDAFMADVLRFKKESESRVLFVVYKRAGSVLREVSTGPVTLEVEGDTVKLKFLSTKGARPLWTGAKEASIKVPNDYSLELDDPTHGRLRYDAKIGLVTE